MCNFFVGNLTLTTVEVLNPAPLKLVGPPCPPAFNIGKGAPTVFRFLRGGGLPILNAGGQGGQCGESDAGFSTSTEKAFWKKGFLESL